MESLLQDYEADLAAAGRAWCLSIPFKVSRQSTILPRLKSALDLSEPEMAILKQRLPGPLFTGRRRCLKWFSWNLLLSGVPCKVELQNSGIAFQLEWVMRPAWDVYSTADALKGSRDSPEVHGGWPNFKEFDCPVPEIAVRYGTSPPRAFQMTKAEIKDRVFDLFEQAALKGNAAAIKSLFCYAEDIEVDRRLQRGEGDTAFLFAIRNGYREVVEPSCSDLIGR
jgi:hypothetical protein